MSIVPLMELDILNNSFTISSIPSQNVKIIPYSIYLIMNNENESRFGFVNFAETWNGRMAMMGILIGLGTELITGQSILRQIGIG